MSKTRDEFYSELPIEDGNNCLHVSSGDYGNNDEQHCCLQIGTKRFTCAYLTDAQVQNLITTLQEYLSCEPDEAKR